MEVECLAVVGPTGIGKSSLAMALAPSLGAEIVNADAIQAYRRLDLGTSKPSLEDRRLVRHHLIDVVAPEERFSAGEFARRAVAAIAEMRGRGALPIVVGGNGFYFRALFEGLSPIPGVPAEVRAALEERLDRESLEGLFQELQAVDERAAERLSPNDKQRILRALEVFQATGKTLSWWQDQKRRKLRIAVLWVGLTLPREVLYDRLASRAHGMLELGWLDEVRGLLMAGIEETSPAFQAIGYRQLAAHLRGRMSLEEAVAGLVQATRRYAKRQLTWFRSESGIRWFEASSEALVPEVLGYLEERGVPVQA